MKALLIITIKKKLKNLKRKIQDLNKLAKRKKIYNLRSNIKVKSSVN